MKSSSHPSDDDLKIKPSGSIKLPELGAIGLGTTTGLTATSGLSAATGLGSALGGLNIGSGLGTSTGLTTASGLSAASGISGAITGLNTGSGLGALSGLTTASGLGSASGMFSSLDVSPGILSAYQNALSAISAPIYSTLSSVKMPELAYSVADTVTRKAAISPSQTGKDTDTKTTQLAKEFDRDIVKIKKDLERETKDLISPKKKSAKNKNKQLSAITKKSKILGEKARLTFVISRVNHAVGARILASKKFRKQFISQEEHFAFVLSIDIRRSTELMLKSINPELYARFISELCGEFRAIIASNNGVFDKFTGDGILAFFPENIAGKETGYFALRSAALCHAAFARVYSSSRSTFTSVLMDVGLGIGIDYGPVRLVQIADQFTVVGVPVVYACRMASGPAGTTLLNQQGFEQVRGKYEPHLVIRETVLVLKHEGNTAAYQVTLNLANDSQKTLS